MARRQESKLARSGARRRSLAIVALVFASLPLAAAAPAAAAEVLFRIEDPRGDDSGDGTLRYPLNYYGLRPGDLDLDELVARRVRGGTEFEVGFAAPVRSPAGRTIDLGGGQLDDVARFGFYALNVDLYIDTDRRPGSGGVRTLPGRKAMLAPETGWERAIVLTPRPHDARSSLRRLLLKDLKRELAGTEESAETVDAMRQMLPAEIEQRVFFPTRVHVQGRRIRFFVPDEFLGEPARADWSYVVFSTAADVDQRFALPASVGGGAEEGLFLLPVAPGGAEDRFGGVREDDRGQPPIVDLLLPPGGSSQQRILADYGRGGDRPVVLTGVVPGPPR